MFRRFIMTDRRRNFDDEALRRHLEQERERDQSPSSPSLVSLVESDGNTVFKPITFFGIIGTIIVAIVTSVTQIINFNNAYTELEESVKRNGENIIEIRNQSDDLKNDLRQQIIQRERVNIEKVENILNRLVELEQEVDSNLRNYIDNTRSEVAVLDTTLVEIKQRFENVITRVRNNELTLKELESEIRVLEIRYERSQN